MMNYNVPFETFYMFKFRMNETKVQTPFIVAFHFKKLCLADNKYVSLKRTCLVK